MPRIDHRQCEGKPFVIIPRQILRRPPIAVRGFETPGCVTPSELRVLCGVLLLTWEATNAQRNAFASQAGRDSMAKQRQLISEWRRAVAKDKKDWSEGRIPKREYPKVKLTYPRADKGKLKVATAIKAAGKYANREARKAWVASDIIEVVTSRNGLLKAAGIAKNVCSMRQIDAMLDRLTQAVGLGTDLPPPLAGWESGSKVTLHIDGRWLQPIYDKVPLPLPTERTVLALYLFLRSINTKTPKSAIPINILFAMLGLMGRGKEELKAQFRRALDGVNDHLEHQIDREALYRARTEVASFYDCRDGACRGHLQLVGQFEPVDWESAFRDRDDEEREAEQARERQLQHQRRRQIQREIVEERQAEYADDYDE